MVGHVAKHDSLHFGVFFWRRLGRSILSQEFVAILFHDFILGATNTIFVLFFCAICDVILR